MEWTRGNTFKTRIFPIPAKGSRTIRVRYINEIQGGGGRPARYRLPLNFKEAVAQFNVRVEVIREEKPPTVESGAPAGFAFKEWRSSYVAEAQRTDKVLQEDLVIALPNSIERRVLVERPRTGSSTPASMISPRFLK